MAGYYGTEAQQRLQARVVAAFDWISSTPGASYGGRAIGCDDLDAFGWPLIDQILKRDGALIFRLIPRDRAAALTEWAISAGYRIDFWDVFIGDKTSVLNAADVILAEGLPDGMKIGTALVEPTGAQMDAIQALMSENGVSPYAGATLAGQQEPSRTVSVVDNTGTSIAVAFGNRPHNTHSRYYEYCLGGAAAVSSVYRGRGLGRFVNALMAERALRELGGTHLYEAVSATNTASRRMVEACGLRHAPELIGAVAVDGPSKFSR